MAERAFSYAPPSLKLAKPAKKETVICPCCGSEIEPPPFAIDLSTNVLIIEKRAFRLSPQMAVFLSVLHSAMPRSVSYDQMIAAMHGVNEPTRAFDSMRVIASACRRLLRDRGWIIVGIPKRGYKLLPFPAFEALKEMPTISGNRLAIKKNPGS